MELGAVAVDPSCGGVALIGHNVTFVGRIPWRVSRVSRTGSSSTPPDTLLVEVMAAPVQPQHLLVMPGPARHETDSLPFRPTDAHVSYASGTTLLRSPGTVGFEDFGDLTDGPAQNCWSMLVDGLDFLLPDGFGFIAADGSLTGIRLTSAVVADQDAAVTLSGPFDTRFAPPLMSFLAGHQDVVSTGEAPDHQVAWVDATHRDAHRSWWQRIASVAVDSGRRVVVRAQCAPQDMEHYAQALWAIASSIRSAERSGAVGTGPR